MTASQQGRSNPYVGPRPFPPGERLYGRDNDVARLRDVLIAERIVLLYSPSGAGKTSLIQAALLPELRRLDFRVLPVIRVGSDLGAPPPTTPASDDARLLDTLLVGGAPPTRPNRYVRSTLASLAGGDARQPSANATLPSYLRQHSPATVRQGTVLIFDQFEEVITADPTDRAAKVEFFTQVGEALRDRNVWALFALREEFLASLDPFEQLVPTRFRSTFRLNLLDAAAARQAIMGPPRRLGVTFTDAAATRLINDLRTVRVPQPDGTTAEQLGQFVEPVQLQVVCYRLWERQIAGRADAVATTIDERAIGGVSDVDTALAEYYAERVARIAAETGVPERAIRAWFDHDLITEQGLRGQVLQQAAGRGDLDAGALRELVNAHLVRAEPRGGATWLELTHDRLIKPIREDNARWREAHLSTFQRQAALWDRAGRPNELLMLGDELAKAEAGLRRSPVQTEAEQAFLERCREADAVSRRERRRNRLIRWLAVVAAVLAVVGFLLALAAISSRAVALSEARRAQTAEALAQNRLAEAEQSERRARRNQAQLLAAQATSALPTNPALGLRLAIEAASRDDRRPLASDTASLDALAPADPVVESALRSALAQSFTTTFSQTNDVLAVTLSPDGSRVTTLDRGGLISEWPVLTPTERVLWPPPDVVAAASLRSAALTADGGRAIGVSVDGDLFVWEASGALLPLRADAGSVASAAISADGRFLAIGGLDGTVELRADDGATLLSGSLHRGMVINIAISADGRHAVSQGADGRVGVWDVGQQAPTVLAPRGAVYSLALSPDGDLVVLSGEEGTEVWGANREPRWEQPNVVAVALAVTTDGRRVFAATADSLISLDARAGASLGMLPGAGEGMPAPSALAVSEDARLVVGAAPGARRSGSRAATAPVLRLWTIGLPTLHAHRDVVQSVAFSPDSRLLVTAGDGLAVVWEGDTWLFKQALRGTGGAVYSAQFSPDGRRIVTASEDGAARIWDLETSMPEQTLPADDGTLYSAQFSPDGARIVTAGDDGVVRVWDANTGELAVELRGHTRAVHSAQFSPDGARIISASQDRTVRVWNAAGDSSPQVFPASLDGVWRAAFDPQGERIVVASGGGTARIWDARSGAELRVFGATGDDQWKVVDAAFSRDGRLVATASWDGKARLWGVGPGADAPPVVLGEHLQAATGVAFSPDGRLLATCGADGMVRLHHVDFELVLAEARQRARLLPPDTQALPIGALQ